MKLSNATFRRFASKGQKVTIFASAGLLFLLMSAGLSAQEEATEQSGRQEARVNLSTTIVGNQEQPKVLYIVPWQAVDATELESQNIRSQIDIVFGHVERVELRRELNYLEKLNNSETKAQDQ